MCGARTWNMPIDYDINVHTLEFGVNHHAIIEKEKCGICPLIM